MSWPVLLLAAGAALVLLVLAAKLRGGGRDDLMGPPRKTPRHLSREELDRLTELVGQGDDAEAMRQLKSAGYDERQSKRLLWLMAKLAEE